MNRREFERLVAEMEPEIRDAFIEAVERFNTDIPIKELEAALEAGDTQRVMELIEVKRGDFSLLDIALSTALTRGSLAAVEFFRALARREGAGIVRLPVDPISQRATVWLRDRSYRFDEHINETQRSAVRSVLAKMASEGRPASSVARDLVGRVNRSTGLREGGILGLTEAQVGYAESAFDELRSGDPAKLRRYLSRRMRDKRGDQLVLRAIKEKKPLGGRLAKNLVAFYRERLLYQRGIGIATNEVRAAVHEARYQVRQSMIESGVVRGFELTWYSRFLQTTRDSHAAMDKMTARHGELFRGILAYPGDTTHGAPPGETINCVCYMSEKPEWA